MLHVIQGLNNLTTWLNHQFPHQDREKLDVFESVDAIRSRILAEGDDALCSFTKEFDGVDLNPNQLHIPKSELENACKQVDATYLEALKRAAANIETFHLNQRPRDWDHSNEGFTYGVQHSPLDSVGLYVPGGKAAYPSSVLMAAIPAKIAGCPRVVVVTPPNQGKIPASVMAAAHISGVHEVYQVGGAQAVFALAYGTPTIQAVDKIVGPGNKYVTVAKQMVYGIVDIDKPAGPSEVCVLMDDPKYTQYAAAEMLAQLEHDPDASAICLVLGDHEAHAVVQAFDQHLVGLSRTSIIMKSKQNAVVVVIDAKDIEAALNACASEHVVLLSNHAQAIRKTIRHAGSIFCGPYTPVALGDYYAGPNHVLPTGRSARFASPLGVMDYMKFSSHLTGSKLALHAIASDLNILTKAEGFDAHFHSLHVRLNDKT